MPIRRCLPLALVFLLSVSRTLAGAQEPTPPQSAESAEAQARTVRDMRNVGTALFSWLVDQVNDETSDATGDSKAESACVSTKKDGACAVAYIDRLPLISHQELTRLLVPAYIDAIPEKDGWNTPYEFRLDRKNVLNKSVMAIRSAGGDRAFSGNRYELGSFLPVEADQDLVWMDGFFIRWPQHKDTLPPNRPRSAPL